VLGGGGEERLLTIEFTERRERNRSRGVRKTYIRVHVLTSRCCAPPREEQVGPGLPRATKQDLPPSLRCDSRESMWVKQLLGTLHPRLFFYSTVVAISRKSVSTSKGQYRRKLGKAAKGRARRSWVGDRRSCWMVLDGAVLVVVASRKIGCFSFAVLSAPRVDEGEKVSPAYNTEHTAVSGQLDVLKPQLCGYWMLIGEMHWFAGGRDA